MSFLKIDSLLCALVIVVRILTVTSSGGGWDVKHTKFVYLSFNQLDAQNFCFTVSLFHASTCFEHHVLIIRRSELYYTTFGIITPIGGRPVHRLRVSSLNLSTGVMIPEAVCYNFDLLMMSTWCSKHVEA